MCNFTGIAAADSKMARCWIAICCLVDLGKIVAQFAGGFHGCKMCHIVAKVQLDSSLQPSLNSSLLVCTASQV